MYKCDICDVDFSRKDSLNVHFKTKKHNANLGIKLDKIIPDNTYRCEICNTNFSNQDSLKEHSKTKKHIKNMGLEYVPDITNKCELCDVTFTCKSSLKSHLKSKPHINKLIPQSVTVNPIEKLEYYFTVKDTKILVDKITYEHVINNNYKISLKPNGYAKIIAKGLQYLLHRYIYYIIYENGLITQESIIDHKNSIKCDNKIENLRECTRSNNNKNRLKSKSATSKYYGVYFHNDARKNKWVCRLQNDEFQHHFSYDLEIHAAFHYDILVKKYNLQEFYKLNNIKQPINFVQKNIKIKKKPELPQGIFSTPNTYGYYYQKKRYGGFKSLQNAIESRQQMLDVLELTKKNKLGVEIIKRNADGIAIIELFNRFKEKVGETMVDDEDYHILRQYNWSGVNGKYVSGRVNNIKLSLSRFLMKCYTSDVVDHVDGNIYNNQKFNLRIVSAHNNSQNKTSRIGSTSKYVGVSRDKHGWAADIKLGPKRERLGRFKTEEEAAIVRDKRAKELNETQGAKFKLNFI